MVSPPSSPHPWLAIVLLTITVAPCSVLCQPLATNEEIFVEQVARSTMSLLDSLDWSPGFVYIAATGKLKLLLEAGVCSAFQRAGWILTDSGMVLDDRPLLLVNASLSGFEFGYSAGSGWLCPGKMVERHLRGQLFLKANGPRMGLANFRNLEYHDKIPRRNVNYVASPAYNELAPEIPSSALAKYLEPLAVVAATGGMLYVFFASR